MKIPYYSKKRLGLLLLLLAMLVVLIDFLAAWGEAGQHPDKIWLHRCNSIEKLQEKHRKFPNIELDVVYSRRAVLTSLTSCRPR